MEISTKKVVILKANWLGKQYVDGQICSGYATMGEMMNQEQQKQV